MRRGAVSSARSLCAASRDAPCSHPVSIFIETFGTSKVDEGEIVKTIKKEFKLTPNGIIETLDLRKPIFKKTAAYGHFGREDEDFTWERTDKTESFKKLLK